MTDGRVATTVQITVKLLLRGLPLPEGARWGLDGYEVLVTGRARPGDWPNDDVQRGDLEAIHWCVPRQVPSVVDNR